MSCAVGIWKQLYHSNFTMKRLKTGSRNIEWVRLEILVVRFCRHYTVEAPSDVQTSISRMKILIKIYGYP